MRRKFRLPLGEGARPQAADEGRRQVGSFPRRVGGDAYCQDLIVYKMFGRIVYTSRAYKFSSNQTL